MTATMTEAVLAARGVNKVFGATHALRDVDFAVRPGQVTALFGENGAGKSTLMKLLAGVEQPTTGEIVLEGQTVELGSPREAADLGIAIIHQELSLFPNVSITDNLFMARERLRGGLVVDSDAEHDEARRLLERLEEPLDPSTPVGELRLGQQQIVEIARALLQDTRVLIMDEPTSALSASEVDVLFRVIRDLCAEGVAVIYISHHLEEALEIADETVVLRDGRLVASAPAAEVDLKWIVENMVGRDPAGLFPDAAPTAQGNQLLQIESLTVSDPATPGRLAVNDVSLTVEAGEVVGLYGLMGAGRTELLETIAGRLRAEGGRVLVGGEDVLGASVRERIAQGVILVPEDRQRDGLVQSMSVGQNLTLAGLGRFVRNGYIEAGPEHKAIERMIGEVTVRTSGPDAPIGSLSGGNQQKVVLGRALLTDPRVLLLDEPTRGIDVGAKAEIFQLVTEQARQGKAVLFATSELAEALNFADRVMVMSRGRVTREFARGTATREGLMEATGEGTHGGGSV